MQINYTTQVTQIDGTETDLSAYSGQVLLIVNTASACGYTPQYRSLQALYQRFKDQGFSVLGFPCNQFGSQEPGTADEIQDFCEKKFSVTFPLFAKIDVNGPNTHPLYQQLKSAKPGLLGSQDIKWKEEAARFELLKLFDAMGSTNPVTISGRRKLASILFA